MKVILISYAGLARFQPVQNTTHSRTDTKTHPPRAKHLGYKGARVVAGFMLLVFSLFGFLAGRGGGREGGTFCTSSTAEEGAAGLPPRPPSRCPFLPGAGGQSRAAPAPTAPRRRGAGRRGAERGAPLRSAPAGRLPPPCPGLRSGGRCGSLPFCSLAPEKANLLLRSDSATAPCLRPARADVSRSSPRRSIGPAGRGAPAQQALAARHRGPGVSQQRPARAAPLGRRQH